MHQFSFRAECPNDVELFLDELEGRGVDFAVEMFPDFEDPNGHGLPDTEVDLKVEAGIDQTFLLKVLDQIDDSHVEMETLRPCTREENSMERENEYTRLRDQNALARGVTLAEVRMDDWFFDPELAKEKQQ